MNYLLTAWSYQKRRSRFFITWSSLLNVCKVTFGPFCCTARPADWLAIQQNGPNVTASMPVHTVYSKYRRLSASFMHWGECWVSVVDTSATLNCWNTAQSGLCRIRNRAHERHWSDPAGVALFWRHVTKTLKYLSGTIKLFPLKLSPLKLSKSSRWRSSPVDVVIGETPGCPYQCKDLPGGLHWWFEALSIPECLQRSLRGPWWGICLQFMS